MSWYGKLMGVNSESDKEVWRENEWSLKVFIAQKICFFGIIRTCLWNWVWKWWTKWSS